MGQVKDTKFDTNVSNKTLLNTEKYQSSSFYRFLVIKGKPTGGGVKLPPPRLWLIADLWFSVLINTILATEFVIMNVSQNLNSV